MASVPGGLFSKHLSKQQKVVVSHKAVSCSLYTVITLQLSGGLRNGPSTAALCSAILIAYPSLNKLARMLFPPDK
jgi:hypothetical protein